MSFETVRAYPTPEPTPTIRIDFSPHGEAFSFNVGETAYSPPGAFYGAVKTTLTFTATTMFPVSTRQPVAYEWEFGDGMVGFNNPATHEYAFPNVFTVHLAVIDNLGEIWRVTKQMYVK